MAIRAPIGCSIDISFSGAAGGDRVGADQLGRALRLLPPEHVADVLEDLEASGGHERGDLLAVGEGEDAVDGAVDDQRRNLDLAEPGAGVVTEDRLRL